MGMDRNRFHRLVTNQPRKASRFAWILWGITVLLILQFFIPIAMNSYEYHFKPEEICGLCPPPPGSLPSHSHSWCFWPGPNRTCPECGHGWNAGNHEIVSMPWIIKAVAILFRWG
jgi:hypothetical protein